MPKPEAVKTMLAVYNSLEDAGKTVSAIIADGIIPATLEMIDRLTIKAVEESIHAGFPLDAEAVLLIELDGVKDGMERWPKGSWRSARGTMSVRSRSQRPRPKELNSGQAEREPLARWPGLGRTIWSATEPSPGQNCRRF